jgi:hypothetical protein
MSVNHVFSFREFIAIIQDTNGLVDVSQAISGVKPQANIKKPVHRCKEG